MKDVTARNDVFAYTGARNDTVPMYDIDADDRIRVKTGSGNDTLRLERNEADRVFAYLGSGDDRVFLKGDTFWGLGNDFALTYLDGSSGNDQVALENGGGELGSLTRKSITRVLSQAITRLFDLDPSGLGGFDTLDKSII